MKIKKIKWNIFKEEYDFIDVDIVGNEQTMAMLLKLTRNYAEQKIAEYFNQKPKPNGGISKLADDIVTYVENNSYYSFPPIAHKEPLLQDVIKSGTAISKGIMCPWCGQSHDPNNSQLNELGKTIELNAPLYEHICKRCYLPAVVRVYEGTLYHSNRLEN